jgi:hypothetical protein
MEIVHFDKEEKRELMIYLTVFDPGTKIGGSNPHQDVMAYGTWSQSCEFLIYNYNPTLQ